MSKLIEFFLGSILIAISAIGLLFFSTLHYILKVSGVADCAWHSSAKVWIDSNRDGHINNRESPLAGVSIHINDIKNNLIDVGWPAITDSYGNVQLNVSTPNCSNSVFEIYADTPDGFRVTTEPRIEVNRDFWGNLPSEDIYYFGF